MLFVAVCVAKYSSVKYARCSRYAGFALSEHIVMLADFGMLLCIAYEIASRINFAL